MKTQRINNTLTEKEKTLNELKKNYIKIGHPIAFSGINNIKSHYPNLTIKEIKNFLSGIYSYTIHRPTRKPKYRNPTYVYNIREQIQLDLLQISNISSHNFGYNFILIAIDIFSRFAWAKLLKTKSSKEVLARFKDILHEAGTYPKTIVTGISYYLFTEFSHYNSNI